MIVRIDKTIHQTLNDFTVIPLTMDVTYEDSSQISTLITQYEQQLKEEYSLEAILNIPLIKEARDSYKKLGKDPSRYRLAVESLYRRIVKGNELYRISNIVDTGNIVSIATMRSVCVVDLDKLDGDVLIRKGTLEDEFEGIGRGILNVSNIPIYMDSKGPFGSTTSDTPRTSITAQTKRILVMIICFSNTLLSQHEAIARELFETYCRAINIKKLDVEGCE